MEEIYVETLADALLAQEVMEEFHGDNDFDHRLSGDCYVTKPEGGEV